MKIIKLTLISHHVLDSMINKNILFETLSGEKTQAELQMFLRIEYNLNLFCYQPNETGYWANNIEHKAKYDSYEEALDEAFLLWFSYK